MVYVCNKSLNKLPLSTPTLTSKLMWKYRVIINPLTVVNVSFMFIKISGDEDMAVVIFMTR